MTSSFIRVLKEELKHWYARRDHRVHVEIPRRAVSELLEAGMDELVELLASNAVSYQRKGYRLRPRSLLDFAESSSYRDDDVVVVKLSLADLEERGILSCVERGGYKYYFLWGELLDPARYAALYFRLGAWATVFMELGLESLARAASRVFVDQNTLEPAMRFGPVQVSINTSTRRAKVAYKTSIILRGTGQLNVAVSADTSLDADEISDHIVLVRNYADPEALIRLHEALSRLSGIESRGPALCTLKIRVAKENTAYKYVRSYTYSGLNVKEILHGTLTGWQPSTEKAEVVVEHPLRVHSEKWRKALYIHLLEELSKNYGLTSYTLELGNGLHLRAAARAPRGIGLLIENFQDMLKKAASEADRAHGGVLRAASLAPSFQAKLLVAIAAGLRALEDPEHCLRELQDFKASLRIQGYRYQELASAANRPHLTLAGLLVQGRLTVAEDRVLFKGRPLEDYLESQELVETIRRHVLVLEELRRARVTLPHILRA